MTIEIKQLIIRAIVDSRSPLPRAEPAPRSPNSTTPLAAMLSRSDRAAIIAACLREIQRELRKARER